jgi:hypothetical protein
VSELIGQLPLADAVFDSQDREQVTEPIRRNPARHAGRTRAFPKETTERRAVPTTLAAIQEDVLIRVCTALPTALAMQVPKEAKRAVIKADHPHVARGPGRLVLLQLGAPIGPRRL